MKMRYSKEFKEQAIKLSDEIGIKQACAQPGLVYATLADWRKSYKRERTFKQKTSEKTFRLQSVKKTDNLKLCLSQQENLYFHSIEAYQRLPYRPL